MTKFRRKPGIVEATQFELPGECKISQGVWVPYKAGDWLVKASGRSWIVEGAVFDKLYEPVPSFDELTDQILEERRELWQRMALAQYSDGRTPAERLEDETAEALF